MSTVVQERLLQLTQFQAQRALTADEQTQLEALRQDDNRITLRKARAYALLSIRGGAPLLSQVYMPCSVLDNTRGKETCDYYERSQSIGAIFCIWNSTGIPEKQPAICDGTTCRSVRQPPSSAIR